ncbi:MAG: PAS domain S-box protein, partial [Anaerolineales bacterium]
MAHDVGLSMGMLRDSSGDPTGFVAIVRDITESKRAEEALRESEEKHRELVENLNDIIYTVDENGVTTYISPVVESVLGYAPSELIGQSFADSMHEEDLPRATENFLSTLSGNTTMGEYRISTKSGEFRLLHSSNRPIFEGNRVVGATGVLTDITERKRAEEALRESEEKYRTILEDIEDGYFEVDIAGNFTFFNDPMCGIIGYSRDEMMGMNNRQFMDKKNAKKVYQAFNRVYTTGKPSKEFGWEITRKDGTKRFIEASVSLKRNSEGEPIGFRGIIRDITEHKSAEEALRKSEEHYRLLAENVTDVIWTMDNNMQFTYISPSVTRQRGYSVEEAMALGMEKSLTPASLEVAAKVILEGLSEEEMGQKDLSKSWTVELEMCCKDGSTIWTEMEATFLRDPDGQVIGIQGVARDITERKRAEKELKETMADLERSNAELEQFAYVASHDLQEPLRMVSSFTQLLAQRYKGKLDADADDFITFAVDGANRMQRLINDLLTYSRVGTRGKPLQTTYCEAVIDQSLDNLKLAIENCGAVITHDPLPSVMADESQLVQLFQNLIDNAIKFRGDQPPRVHVGVESKDGEWVFSVHDNGIGIDPEHFDRIFVIFQRLHGKQEYAGTGMGLATSKKIVERHAGRIWVESKPGKGATFYFTMPNIRR